MKSSHLRASFSFKMAGVFFIVGVVSVIGVFFVPRPVNGVFSVTLFLSQFMVGAFIIQGIYRLVKQSEQKLDQPQQIIIQQVPMPYPTEPPYNTQQS